MKEMAGIVFMDHLLQLLGWLVAYLESVCVLSYKTLWFRQNIVSMFWRSGFLSLFNY